ncbi:peptidoglycan-binding protein [Streptomyces ziwulingensis]
MAPWRSLPENLSPSARHLVTGLRELKDRTGMSLAALERRTGYSRSSWERYLNGKKLPPRGAVAELAALAGEDAARLHALHALAADGWHAVPSPARGSSTAAGDREPVDGAAPTADGGTTPSRAGEAALAGDAALAGGAAAPRPAGAAAWARHRAPYLMSLLILASTFITVAATWDHGATTRRERPDDFVFEPGVTYDCPVERRGAALTAGYSDTRQTYLHQLVISWDVVEAQCLLEYHGFPVAEVDGAYDAMTERAVKRFQEDRGGLVVDGVIGEHTWEALRR